MDDPRHIAGLTTPELVQVVREQIGEALTRYLMTPAPTDAAGDAVAARRLRTASFVSTMIAGAYDSATAQTWLFGSNSHLDDRAPIDLLRSATDDRALGLVRDAAAAFVAPTG